MTTSDNDGEDADAQGRRQARLSEETVEQIKREILFGVGDGRPPKQYQFRKGQSGNPKGRPKSRPAGVDGNRAADALVLREAERLIAVRDGEEIKEIPAIEAVLRAQYAAAAKGNAYAQKHIIERYERAEGARHRKIEEENEIWRSYVAVQRAAIAEAERNGEAPPTDLPHPDDVVIDEDKGVRFIGPLNEQEVRQLEETCRLRDLLLMQDALDQRAWDEPASDDPLDGPGTALVFAELLNRYVPARHRLSEFEIERRMMRYLAVPKRRLLKDVYRGWRSLGVRVRRGRVSPPWRVGKQSLEFLAEVLQRMRDGRLDVANSTPEELTAEIEAIILERRQVVG